jgi:WD40 repeat protein
MNKKLPITLLLLIAGLGGCAAPASTIEPSPTRGIDTPTVEITDTPRPTPTAASPSTPEPTEPPTQTPAPTATPYQLPDDFPIVYPTGAAPEGAIVRIGIGEILEVELSQDEQWIAVGTMTGLYMFDANTFETRWGVTTERPVCKVDWSPDGSMLSYLLANDDCAWNVSGRVADSNTGTTIREFEDANDLDWAPGSSLLAVTGAPGVVVWDTRTWEIYRLYEESGLSRGRWSPDGSVLAVSRGGEVRIIDTTSFEVVYSLDTVFFLAQSVFSPDSRFIAIYALSTGTGGVTSFETMYVYDLNKGEIIYRYFHEAEEEFLGLIFGLEFSPDGTIIAVEGGVGTTLVDAATGKVLHSQIEGLNVSGFSPDGKYVIIHKHEIDTNPRQNYLALWNVETGEFDNKWPLGGEVREWFGDSQRFLLDYGGKLIQWHIDEDVPRSVLASQSVSCLYFYSCYENATVFWSPDGQYLAVKNHSDDTYNVWDSNSGHLVDSEQSAKTFDGWTESPQLRKVNISDDYIAEGYTDEIIQIHFQEEKEEWRTIKEWIEIENLLTGESFAVFETWLAEDWDLLPYEFLYSPDGNRIALIYCEPSVPSHSTWGDAQTNIISVWDIETGEQLYRLVGHTAGAYTVAFSPDGTRLASVSADGSIVIWDVE